MIAVLFMQLSPITTFCRTKLVIGNIAFSSSSLITKPCRNFAHVSGIYFVTRRPLHPLSKDKFVFRYKYRYWRRGSKVCGRVKVAASTKHVRDDLLINKRFVENLEIIAMIIIPRSTRTIIKNIN